MRQSVIASRATANPGGRHVIALGYSTVVRPIPARLAIGRFSPPKQKDPQMSKITYGAPMKSTFGIPVFLDGRRVGTIRQSENGGAFFYRPAGTSGRGQSFPTIALVKRSLEGR